MQSWWGTLDYVTGWYIKAAKYIQNTKIKVAFVSTNSIVQGEQTNFMGFVTESDTISKFILLIELLNGVMKLKEMQQFTVLSLVSLTTTLTIREFLSMKILEVKHTRLKQKISILI
jgi:kynurenine formamidase